MSIRKILVGLAAALIFGIVTLFVVLPALSQGPALPPGEYDLEEGRYTLNEPDGDRLVLDLGVPPTSTSVPPTDTPIPPTDTPVPDNSAWHSPSTHEHGDVPPQWVLESPSQPDFDKGEAHSGFKGFRIVQPDGLEAYFLVHIISVPKARLTQFHSYQAWVLDTSGNISYWNGKLNAGTQRCGRLEIGCDDTAKILVVDHPAFDGGITSEQWYTASFRGWFVAWRISRPNYFANLPEDPDPATWELFREPNTGLTRAIDAIWYRNGKGIILDQEFCTNGVSAIVDCAVDNTFANFVYSTMPFGTGSLGKVQIAENDRVFPCPDCEVPN